MSVKKLFASMAVCLIAFGCGWVAFADEEEMHDKGYTTHGPHVTYSKCEFENGMSFLRNTVVGTTGSEDPESPMYHARGNYFGTQIRGADGTYMAEVGVLALTDPDGDTVYMPHFVWYIDGPESVHKIFGGSGKWQGIVGDWELHGRRSDYGYGAREDDGYNGNLEINWKIDKDAEVPTLDDLAEQYGRRDTVTAFLNPSVTLQSSYPWRRDGRTWSLGYHTGVTIADNPESPFHNASFFMQGYDAYDADGNHVPETTLWATDSIAPDGDAVFMALVSEPGEPMRLLITGGIGKWYGIRGEGQVLEAVPRAADDLSMHTFEIFYEVGP